MEGKKIATLLKLLEVPNSAETSLLDFGCGSGEKVKFLRECGYNFIGCDIEFKNGRYTNSLEENNYITKIGIDPYRIPFPDDHFDFILSDQVLEHVFNYEEVLIELSRVLKNGNSSLHIFPSKWKVFEAHTGTPFGGALNSYLWILFWALVGINKRKHKNLSRFEIARLDYEYLKNKTNYLSGRQINRLFNKYGFTVHYRNDIALRLSSNKLISKFISLFPFSSMLSKVFAGRFIVATLKNSK